MTPPISLEKLRKVMNAIAEKKGEFSAFAVVMRVNTPWLWDLVVAAPWLKSGIFASAGEVFRLLEKQLGKRALRRLGVLVLPNTPETRAELAELNIDGGETRIYRRRLFGAEVEEAVMLRAKPVAGFGLRASRRRRPAQAEKRPAARRPAKRVRNRASEDVVKQRSTQYAQNPLSLIAKNALRVPRVLRCTSGSRS